MRYFGSKSFTAERVYRLVSDRLASGSFCDPFGGIGIVGARFKRGGYSVHSGDILVNAHNFQIARIERRRSPSFARVRAEYGLDRFEDVIQLLNTASQSDGWFVREYSRKRRFFTEQNAKQIAGSRLLINKWWRKGLLSRSEQAVLLASLVNSMDKVANTAGTYYAYLKTWYRKAKKPFRFQLIQPTPGSSQCRACLCDATQLVAGSHFDILYLDPPYNERCYAGYYHLPETIALGKTPHPQGKSGVPRSQRTISLFNRPGTASSALVDLLDRASFDLLAFHYSDKGLIPRVRIQSLLKQYGTVEEILLDTRGYTTSSRSRMINHRLYLVHHA